MGVLFISRLNKICIFKVQGFKCQFSRDTLGCNMLVDVLSSTGNDGNENGDARTVTDRDGVSVKFCVLCVCVNCYCVCVCRVVSCRSVYNGCVCLLCLLQA